MELLFDILLIFFPTLFMLCIIYFAFVRRSTFGSIIVLVIGLSTFQWLIHHMKVIESSYSNGHYSFGFEADTWLLFTLSLICIAVFVGCTLFQSALNQLVIWRTVAAYYSVTAGLFGGFIIAIPIILWNGQFNVIHALTTIQSYHISIITFVAALKSIEELFYRGYLQGKLEISYSKKKAMYMSIFIYLMVQAFLLLVTNQLSLIAIVYVIVIAFVCTFLRNRYGIIAAIVANSIALLVLYYYSNVFLARI